MSSSGPYGPVNHHLLHTPASSQGKVKWSAAHLVLNAENTEILSETSVHLCSAGDGRPTRPATDAGPGVRQTGAAVRQGRRLLRQIPRQVSAAGSAMRLGPAPP